jgi:hypothetical protein
MVLEKGKSVFLLDDPEGKVWVVKAFRDTYGQTRAINGALRCCACDHLQFETFDHESR